MAAPAGVVVLHRLVAVDELGLLKGGDPRRGAPAARAAAAIVTPRRAAPQ
jgi:hypothetical protein